MNIIGVWLIVFVVTAVGWVMNIIEIVNTLADPLTAMEVFRCVGVFIFPLGAILGYV